MQPVEHRQRGPAILLVISGDLAEELIIVAFAPVLVIDNRFHAGPHGSKARELEKRFQFLERVTRHSGSQGLTKKAVQINEYFSPQKIVDLGLSRRIDSHQLLNCALLVCAVVIHVKIRIKCEPDMNKIDKVLKRATLSGIDRVPRMVDIVDNLRRS